LAAKKGVTLAELSDGMAGTIVSVDLPSATRTHLFEMGISKGRAIRLIRRAPLGDPLEVEVLDYRLAVRVREAGAIRVRVKP